MKNAKRWLALLLAVCMTVSTASPGVLGSMNVVQAAEAETEVQAVAQLNETAIPRYSSIRIMWNAEAGHTYDILRSETADGQFAKITSNAVVGSEYIDETAGSGKIWYYRVTDAETGVVTDSFCNEEATGFNALAERAEFKWVNDPDDPTEFAGNTVLSFEGENIADIRELSAGTIIYKGYQNTSTGTDNKVLLGLKGGENGTATGYFGERSDRRNQLGIDMLNLITNWKLAFPTSFVGSESSKHAVGYISPKTEAAADMFISFDGNGNRNNGWTSSLNSYGGFMQRCKLNELTIGGFGTEGAVTNGWNGGIDYVIITSEVLSQNEVKAITTAKPNLEPEKTVMNAKAIPGYSSIKLTWDAEAGAAYTISRSATADGEFTELAADVTASPYVDEVKVGESWYYQIKNNTTEEVTEAFTNKMPAGIDAFKKYAQFKWVNDGNTVFNGSKGLKFSGDDITAVKELTSGTIIAKGYLNSGTANNGQVLLGFKKDAAQAFFGTRSNKGGQWGWELGNLINGWNISLTGVSLVGTSSSKHVTGYVSPEKSANEPMILSFDGNNKTNNNQGFNWRGSFGGFMKQMGITAITIGAFVDDNNAVSGGWNGGIDYVYITDEVLTQAEIDAITGAECIEPDAPVVSGKNIGEMFNNAYDNNSWVFTGGEDVQGGFAQVGGARNYIGQFEEYVRWKLSGNEFGRQRYTINTAKKGQTLAKVVENWENRVAEFDPKAVAYMVGAEDYLKDTAGINDFKTQLKLFIDKALAMRGNNGFAVIQKPYVTKDDAKNAQIEKYCAAVDEVVKEYKDDAAKLGRIVIVDHYTQTKAISNFKTTMLNADGTLNVQGHFEIGKQFCAATIKNTNGYPADHAELAEVAEPAAKVYSDAQPTATASANALEVTIPAKAEGSSWKYTLAVDGMEIKDTVSERVFTISDLPAGKAYTLTIQTADGTTQLVTVAGKIADGEVSSKKAPTLNANQTAIKEKMAEGPLTWLFIGDSITHAAMWTNGYDGIAQSFEKFLKDDLGRMDDVVINTAVSGATTTSTLNTINQRLEKYSPDVVSIMLGTNDCATSGLTPAKYEADLKLIIQKAQEKGAIVVLRTPTSGTRDAQLSPYIEKMKKVAEEDPTLIYIDQFTEMKKAYDVYSYLFDDFYLDYGNGWSQMGLHPGPNGHLIMMRQFIEGCGLWTDDAHMTNLFYDMKFAAENNTTALPLTKAPDKIGLSVKALAAATGKSIGSVTITATDGTKSYTASTKLGGDETTLSNLKGNTTYEVTVKAYLKDAKKIVTFNPVEVTLSDDMELDFNIGLSNVKVRNLAADSEVGTLSVSEMAPAGNYTYELCDGENADGNAFFKIAGNKLVVAKELTEKETYSVRIKAVNDKYAKEQVFEIIAVGSGFIFEEKDVQIVQGSAKSLTDKAYAEELMGLEEGTIIVQYTSTSNYIIQSLFSASNGTAGNNDRHFHVYVRDNGTLGYEIRNTNGEFNLGGTATNAVKVTYKGKPAKNTIAFKADKEAGQYKLFANGKLVATIAANAGYKFISDITGVDRVNLGATIRGEAAQYTFGGTIHYAKGYSVPLADAELEKITGETSYEDLQQIFHSNDATGSNYFRIPALYTTEKGTVIAAIDARFGGTHDSPNNIDTAVARSTDGGKTWADMQMPLYFDDYADDKITMPVGTNLRVNGSASYIDPQLLQDRETGKIFLIADAMPSGIGSPQAKAGNGYKTIGDKQYRMLKKAGEADYNYSIHEDNFIYDDRTGTKTEYSVNENFEILKDGILQTVKQKSVTYDPTSAGGAILTSITNKDVAMNIMYDTATFQVFPTNYLYMVTSEDEGKTWSAPIDITPQVKKTTQEDRILITGPGRGMQIENGEYAGRLIIPVYKASGCDMIYSDDHGDTWTFAEGPALASGVAMSESQIVEMPDGSLKVFARANAYKMAMATSIDGGLTWNTGNYVDGISQPSYGSQLSVINYSRQIDGKPAIILSTPVGSGRNDGRVKIGLITDTGAEGYDKYSIEWRYDYEINAPAIGFGYSCMTELPNGNVGILYEQYDSYATSQLQSKDAIKYEELSIAELRNRDSVEVIPVSDGHGTVSLCNIVDPGSEVTVKAVPNDDYKFVSWTDADGNVVSTDAEYTFTINETTTLKANFVTDYTVTVVGGTIAGSEETTGNYSYNTMLTVTAGEPEGNLVFAGWNVKANDDEKGMVLSVNREYTFFVGSNLTLTAVYAEKEPEVEPQGYLQSVTADKRADGKYDLRYLAQLVVPGGYEIKQAGLLWSAKGETYLKELEFNSEDAGVKRTFINRISSTHQFSVTIKGVPEGTKVPGRIFAVLENADGERIIQSEPILGTAK